MQVIALAVALGFAIEPPAPRVVIVPDASSNIDDAGRRRLQQAAQVAGERNGGLAFDLRDDACPDRACIDGVLEAPEVSAAVLLTVDVEGRDYAYKLELFDPALPVGVNLSIEDTCEVCGLEEVGALVEGSMAKLLERYARALTPATLTLSTQPGGAQVVDDEDVVGTTPLDLELAPGEHTFELRLPGYEPQRRTVTIGAGERLAVDAKLVAIPDRTRPWRPLAITGIVLIAAGMPTLATGIALVAIDERSVRCDDEEANELGVCPRRYSTLEGGAAAVAIGGAALVAGVVLEVVAQRRRKQPRVSLRPRGLAVRF